VVGGQAGGREAGWKATADTQGADDAKLDGEVAARRLGKT
jgi:hypothetical protein